MTTLLVNISDEQEERALLDFLNSHKYNYITETQSSGLSEAQKIEILRREQDFKAGKIKSEPWEEVRKRFLRS
jgi:putative addiction module component (TIGR02574 family)